MKLKKSKITESEWTIMKVLWSEAPLSAKEILKKLSESVDWKENTVKTLISRLVDKEAVGYEKQGRTYLYYPLQKENECVQVESQHFLNKVFGGATKSLIASFIENENLSEDDIKDLKKLLDDQLK